MSSTRVVKANVLDMIRHEFGRALVNLYPDALKKGGLFRAAFGGAYVKTLRKSASRRGGRPLCLRIRLVRYAGGLAETFRFFIHTLLVSANGTEPGMYRDEINCEVTLDALFA